jgi:hypothetical protein
VDGAAVASGIVFRAGAGCPRVGSAGLGNVVVGPFTSDEFLTDALEGAHDPPVRAPRTRPAGPRELAALDASTPPR